MAKTMRKNNLKIQMLAGNTLKSWFHAGSQIISTLSTFSWLITCSSSVDESCRLEPADSDERNLGGGFGGTLPEKHSDICM